MMLKACVLSLEKNPDLEKTLDRIISSDKNVIIL